MNWPTLAVKMITILGIVPFLIAMGASFSQAGGQLWSVLVVVISTYTALIVTFIAGGQWGITRHYADKSTTFIVVTSSLVTLLAWVGLLFPSWIISWLILLACLWIVLFLDYKLMRQEIWPKAYLRLRFWVTVAVTLCFITMIYLGQQYFY